MDASLYEKQHREIIALLDEVSRACHEPITRETGARIRLALVSLSGKVITHLAAEDNMLYPRLLQSSNPEVATLARKFSQEMGNLAEVFERYLNEWMLVSVIVENSERFCSESEKVFSALRDRIAKEEKELYILTKQV